MKKLIFSIGLLISLGNLECSGKDDFLVPKKKFIKKSKRVTKRSLKENIGDITERSFEITNDLLQNIGKTLVDLSSIQKKITSKIGSDDKEIQQKILDSLSQMYAPIGNLQIDVSTIQKSFSKIIKNLVNNKQPFKRAGKSDLRITHACVKQMRKDLSEQLDAWRTMGASITRSTSKEKAKILKKLTASSQQIQQCVKNIKSVQEKINTDVCLKSL